MPFGNIFDLTKTCLRPACILVAATVITPAQAGLINVNTLFGANTAVVDSVTGKTWLKFSTVPRQNFETLGPLLGTGNYAGFRLATSAEVGALRTNHFADFAATPAGMSAGFAALTGALGVTTLRDGPGGNGCALEFTGVTAEILPGVEVTPLNSSGTGPAGPNRISGAHGIRGIGIAGRTDNSVPCGGPTMITNEGIFGGSQWLDVFSTQTIVFGTDFNGFFISQRFFPVSPFNNFSIPRSNTGFWLVADAAAVAEPVTVSLLGIGFAGLAIARRKKRLPADRI
jgi:hypothetical protein